MKTSLVTVWSLLTMLSQPVVANTLTVTVNGIETHRGGQIMVMVFAEPGFPKNHEKALIIKSAKDLKDTMTFSFDIDEQEVAIKVLHDENSDGKVTKNWTGIWPKEGLGFSNGQKVSLSGVPKFNKSK